MLKCDYCGKEITGLYFMSNGTFCNTDCERAFNIKEKHLKGKKENGKEK